MAEDKGRGGPHPNEEPPDDMNEVERSRGSGLIFVLVVLALILAISFFYMTKDRQSDQGRALTDAADSADSAARVVGDAAQNAADRLNRN